MPSKKIPAWTLAFSISSVLLILVLFSTMLPGCSSPQKSFSTVAVPSNTPFNMPEIKIPIFPERSFDIRSYGAVGDGKTKNTKAFADAIDACSKTGGGIVIVPAGTWLTGKIHLKNNVNLHLQDNAEIRFSTEPNDYLPVVFTRWSCVECYNYSPLLYADNCQNIAITGTGRINGQGSDWWPWIKKEEPAFKKLCAAQHEGIAVKDRLFGTEKDALRPPLIQLINCRNILLEDFTAENSPFWNVHLVYCRSVLVRNVKLKNPDNGPNADGLDLDSCNGVLVEKLYADVGDDGLCLKSGRDEDAWRIGKPCQNIVITNCRIKQGHGGFVIGSEMSGSVGNVFLENCLFDGTDRGIRMKSRRGRGGIVENIYIQNITMNNIQAEAIQINMFYTAGPQPISTKPGVFRNIHIKNVTCQGAKDAIQIVGLPEKLVENITLENVNISAKNGATLTDAKNIKMTNVNIESQNSPVFEITDSRDITIENSTYPAPTEVFLKLSGSKTKNIKLTGNNLSNADKQILLDDNVPDNAVLHKR